ncbi:MAG: hypothetical protein ACKO24_09810 [Leptolyngbyaceae cyanobacterium]
MANIAFIGVGNVGALLCFWRPPLPRMKRLEAFGDGVNDQRVLY